MRRMTRRALLRRLDQDRVETAIRQAEQRTSGEIRVSVAPFFWGNVNRVAEKAFQRLGMTATRDRNGVLLFLVPSRRRLVVLGDQGIHARVGQAFWEELVRRVAERFRARDFTDGMVQAVELLGERLAEHFPCEPDDRNELSDRIDLDH